MSFHGTYLLGPINFRRGEFLPGAVDPAAVRVGLILAGGQLAADWVGGNERRVAQLARMEVSEHGRVLGFVGDVPIVRQRNGSVQITIAGFGLTELARLLCFLRQTSQIEIVTGHRGQVVTHRLLDWLCDQAELERQWKADGGKAEGRSWSSEQNAM